MQSKDDGSNSDDLALYLVILWKPAIMIVMGLMVWIINFILDLFR
jgi:hypothetical protein